MGGHLCFDRWVIWHSGNGNCDSRVLIAIMKKLVVRCLVFKLLVCVYVIACEHTW